MNTIKLNTNNLPEMFSHLNHILGGELTSSQKEYILTINNNVAKGEIRGVSINQNISFFEYDITFSEDFAIVRNASIHLPIYFLYCSEGQPSHSFGLNSKLRTLDKYQTGIFASGANKDNCLYFKNNQRINVTSISVDTHPKVQDDETVNYLQEKLTQTFMPEDIKEIFAYKGSYNLKIAEKLQQIEAVKQDGIVRRLLIKGIVHVILALEIQQHEDDLKNDKQHYGSLSRSEMDTINELLNSIKKYPERKYTLDSLSKKAGMSPAKLQEGFKLLHNRTVSDYIRNTRVEVAENLLKTTDLNISEIVYSIGLTSRSYFSKIFKEKYNCTPKSYQDNQNTRVVMS